MSRTGGVRRLRGRKLRPVFEMLLLAASVVAGLGVVEGCVSAASGAGAGLSVLSVVAGAFFAVTLVGAVFLFTTTSRDLRLLRQQYLKNDAARAASQASDDRSAGGPADADV